MAFATTRLAGTEASLDATRHNCAHREMARSSESTFGFRASCCKVDHPWASLSSDSKEEAS